MRPEKQLLMDGIKEKMTQSRAMVLIKYDRFSPNMSWDFISFTPESM